MNNTMRRTISETKRNLVAENPLSYNDILALIDAYEYGTATPMIALIKCLRMMYLQVETGKQIHYIDKNGYEKTTVNEIIKKANTSKGGFYYYFKAKEELLNSLYAIFVPLECLVTDKTIPIAIIFVISDVPP